MLTPKWRALMDENTQTASADDDQNTGGAPQHDVADLQAEIEKWKRLSRQNEKRWHEVSQERDQLQQSQMTDAEKAIEQARQEARAAALSEFGADLASAEMAAQAAQAGVLLPDTQYLNMAGFLGTDGRPDREAISAFVSSIPKPQRAPEYPQNVGLGRQSSGSGDPNQLTRDEYNRLSREDKRRARSEGRVNSLLKGEI